MRTIMAECSHCYKEKDKTHHTIKTERATENLSGFESRHGEKNITVVLKAECSRCGLKRYEIMTTQPLRSWIETTKRG